MNQINNQDDDRNYEQEMDQTAANVAKKAKKPEHDQDNNYRPEHGVPFGWVKLSPPIYPEIRLLAKLFQNIESNGSPKLASSKKGERVVLRVRVTMVNRWRGRRPVSQKQ